MRREKIIILVIVGLLIWIFGPHLLYLLDTSMNNNNSNTSVDSTVESQKANLENQYRVTITQAFVGIAVLYGVYQSWQRITIAEDNLKISQEGQITERFTRAIDHLGRKELEIRLGGIYALERIAKESDADYWPIMEILTAYVRMNSNVKNASDESLLPVDSISMDIQAKESRNGARQKKLSLDIQAVLTVLGRRKHRFCDGESERLIMDQIFFEEGDLKKAHLEGARFTGANFRHTNLVGANLSDANFWNADLQDAFLKEANLQDAFLREANFCKAELQEADLTAALMFKANFKDASFLGAILKEVHLQGANLEGAILTGANLTKANLEGTNLTGVSFTDANITEANLTGANLTGANLGRIKLKEIELEFYRTFTNKAIAGYVRAYYNGVNLTGAIWDGNELPGANLTRANLTRADFTEANLTGADLTEANLTEANLTGTKLEGADLRETYGLSLYQLSKVKTLYQAKLDEELEISLKEKYPVLFEKPDYTVK